MKPIIIFFTSIIILYFGSASWADAPTAKPATSVKVLIETEEPLTPGETALFTVKAYSRIDADNFRIWAELPGGIKFISGNLYWSGPVKRDEEYSINFTVVVPENGMQVIKAGARMQLHENTIFTDRASFRIGKNIEKNIKKKKVPHRSFIRDRKGVVEYELK